MLGEKSVLNGAVESEEESLAPNEVRAEALTVEHIKALDKALIEGYELLVRRSAGALKRISIEFALQGDNAPCIMSECTNLDQGLASIADSFITQRNKNKRRRAPTAVSQQSLANINSMNDYISPGRWVIIRRFSEGDPCVISIGDKLYRGDNLEKAFEDFKNGQKPGLPQKKQS